MGRGGADSILVGKPEEGPRSKWEANIKVDLQEMV
jgi:hypothetical protein